MLLCMDECGQGLRYSTGFFPFVVRAQSNFGCGDAAPDVFGFLCIILNSSLALVNVAHIDLQATKFGAGNQIWG